MKTNSNHSGLFAAISASVLGLTAIAGAVADEAPPSVRHFQDSSTDRVPAMTAFPIYPSIARRDRIEGEATVCFKVKANGKISNLSVQSSTHKIFSRPSLRAMKKSSFEPLAPGQVLARSRTCRTYRFRLDPVVDSGETS